MVVQLVGRGRKIMSSRPAWATKQDHISKIYISDEYKHAQKMLLLKIPYKWNPSGWIIQLLHTQSLKHGLEEYLST
jgi:hypothetical protein